MTSPETVTEPVEIKLHVSTGVTIPVFDAGIVVLPVFEVFDEILLLITEGV